MSLISPRRWRPLLAAVAASALGLSLATVAAPSSVGVDRIETPWIGAQKVNGALVDATVVWEGAAAAQRYELAYTKTAEFPFSAPDSVKITTTARSALVQGLAPDTMYCFAVRAFPGGNSVRACRMTMPLSRAVTPSAFTMHAGTYNVHCANTGECNEGWKWKKRRKQVLDRITRMRVDVLALQEADVAFKHKKKKQRITKALKTRGYVEACRTVNKGKKERKQRYSQVLYVRSSLYAVLSPSSYSKGGQFKAFNDAYHGYCHALVQHRASGKQAVVVSTHLADGDGNRDGVRQAETRYLLAKVTSRFGAPTAARPVVMLGDFNSHRGRDRLGQSDAPRLVLEAAGYDDALDVAGAMTLPYLNSANRFEVVAPRSDTSQTHVDRIFVSAGVSVPSWSVIAVLKGGRYTTPIPSDHNPVRATLYLP